MSHRPNGRSAKPRPERSGFRLDGQNLTIERRELLKGDGHVVLTSQPNGLAAIPLDVVETELPVRERFVILSSSIAADVEPISRAA